MDRSLQDDLEPVFPVDDTESALMERAAPHSLQGLPDHGKNKPRAISIITMRPAGMMVSEYLAREARSHGSKPNTRELAFKDQAMPERATGANWRKQTQIGFKARAETLRPVAPPRLTAGWSQESKTTSAHGRRTPLEMPLLGPRRKFLVGLDPEEENNWLTGDDAA